MDDEPWWQRAYRHPDAPPVVVLAVMMAAYVAVFGTLTWRQQSHFGTFGFDMGIHDQGIWLLSRFRDPYDTVVGRNYLGHHVNLVSLLFVPAYWLGAGPHFLYLAETLALAVGALPVWLLARDRLGNGWTALPLAAAYLLYPSIEWINWWHFHPDALMVTPLLLAWWLAARARWRWFAAAVAVLLVCKEDAALAVAALGAVLVIRRVRERGPRAWKAGAVTAAVGAGWFLVATKALIPLLNGGQRAFYEDMFPAFGHGLGTIAFNFVAHPSRLWHLATKPDRLRYYRQLLAPVGAVALGAPLPLLIAAPQLAVNVTASLGYTHDIRYHYSSIVAATVLIATVEAIGRWRHRPAVVRALVGLVAATALAANVDLSPSPLGTAYHSGIWAPASPRIAALDAAVGEVPPGAGVSASYTLVPHLTHRATAYEFPNPWVLSNWLDRRRRPDPAKVQFLVLDRTLNPDQAGLIDELTGATGPFEIVYDRDQVIVARRVVPPSGANGGQ
ncbi:MAG TPA: DUF2079 domain-containing protein [Acidimicrobiales bacterium]